MATCPSDIPNIDKNMKEWNSYPLKDANVEKMRDFSSTVEDAPTQSAAALLPR